MERRSAVVAASPPLKEVEGVDQIVRGDSGRVPQHLEGLEEDVVVEEVDAAGKLGRHVGRDLAFEYGLLIGGHRELAVDDGQAALEGDEVGGDLREGGLGAEDDGGGGGGVVGHGGGELPLVV
jgi:tetrahydromethanopterin S-methyltransferase subunit G